MELRHPRNWWLAAQWDGDLLRATLDEVHGLIYIEVRAHGVASTLRLSDDVIADLDEHGQLVGVELLKAGDPVGARTLVCGGRDYRDERYLGEILDALNPSAIGHGRARGADRLAGAWATARRVEERAYPAGWTKFGHAAGPIRNREMLVDFKPDVVVAFPGRRGTTDMIGLAEARGVPVIRIAPRLSVPGR
jgi:uncharacterized protein YuzE